MRKFFIILSVLLIITSGCTFLAPSIVVFSANPPIITAGSKTTLIWNATGVNSVTLDQGIGVVQPAGALTVSPTATTAYTLTASSIAGTVSRSVVVTVNPAIISANIDINPAVIVSGESATLVWNVIGATSVTIDKDIGIVPAADTRVVSPNSTTTYTLTAVNNTNVINKTVTITVNPPVIATLEVNPNIINAGKSANLQWNVTGATSVSINQDIGNVPPMGFRVVSPQISTNYILTASSSCCSIGKSVILTVGRSYPMGPFTDYGVITPYGYPYGQGPYTAPYFPPSGYPYGNPYGYGMDSSYGTPFVEIFSISPGQIRAGESAGLHWSVLGASSVYINSFGFVEPNGSRSVMPIKDTTYTLVASNNLGTTTRVVSITVSP